MQPDGRLFNRTSGVSGQNISKTVFFSGASPGEAVNSRSKEYFLGWQIMINEGNKRLCIPSLFTMAHCPLKQLHKDVGMASL